MAGRGRAHLIGKKPASETAKLREHGRPAKELSPKKAPTRASHPNRRGPASSASHASTPRLLYTAQDVARFCEVDLKTIHHWADGGKIPHHRTEGRHLRFRRNHLVRFLRAHGYPLPDELASARPTIFLALSTRSDGPDGPLVSDEVGKKLAARFFVQRFEHAIAAIANLVAGEPDAIVCALDDPTWSSAAIAALKANAATSWPLLVVVTREPSDATTGADLVIHDAEINRLPAELAKSLGVA
jgi:excisionase family DNA binding protein